MAENGPADAGHESGKADTTKKSISYRSPGCRYMTAATSGKPRSGETMLVPGLALGPRSESRAARVSSALCLGEPLHELSVRWRCSNVYSAGRDWLLQ